MTPFRMNGSRTNNLRRPTMPWAEILIFLGGVVVGALVLAAYCVLAINTKRGGPK